MSTLYDTSWKQSEIVMNKLDLLIQHCVIYIDTSTQIQVWSNILKFVESMSAHALDNKTKYRRKNIILYQNTYMILLYLTYFWQCKSWSLVDEWLMHTDVFMEIWMQFGSKCCALFAFSILCSVSHVNLCCICVCVFSPIVKHGVEDLQ